MIVSKILRRWFGESIPTRKPVRFRPGVEALESRWNPANVTAAISNGVLTLTAAAGAFDDQIAISRDLETGRIDLNGTGTTINGANAVSIRGVRSIVCTMKGGNDTVTFDAYVKGDITFNGGGGTNKLELDGGFVGGSVHYLNGTTLANDDTLEIFAAGSLVIGRDVTADFGEGTSEIMLSGVTIGGKVAVTAGSGADTIATNGLILARSLTASLGDGDNFVGIESNNDNISGGGTTFLGGALFVTSGTGRDTIEIGQEDLVQILGSVTLLTGNEATNGDTVTIDNTEFFGSILLDLGAGNDVALFETVDNLNTTTDIGGTLSIFGRGGNDTIGFGQTSGARHLVLSLPPVLDGNSGNDGLLLIRVTVGGVNVDNVTKLGLPPLHFESVVF